VAGADPHRPYTMRELWWMACGVWDREIDTREFWTVALGGKAYTADQRAAAHPLRRLEAPPEPAPGPSPEVVAETLDSLFIED
jgi:hypothetical protein